MRYILFILIVFSFISCKKENFGCTDCYASNYDSDAVYDDGSCNYNCSCGEILQIQLIANTEWIGPIEDPDYLEFWVYSITVQNICSDNLKKFVVDTDTLDIGQHICVDSLTYW
jgi:hypothetical protein